jgi:hypothetical protein
MTHSLQHRDIAGSHLSPGDHCLVTEHNRIILARVVKLYEASNQLQLQPLSVMRVVDGTSQSKKDP